MITFEATNRRVRWLWLHLIWEVSGEGKRR